MKIKTELIKGYIADVICGQVSDFEIVEEIVKVFIKYELSYGSVHDF